METRPGLARAREDLAAIGLTEEMKRAVIARFYDFLTPAQHAAKEGITVNAANDRLNRANRKLIKAGFAPLRMPKNPLYHPACSYRVSASN